MQWTIKTSWDYWKYLFVCIKNIVAVCNDVLPKENNSIKKIAEVFLCLIRINNV